MVKERGPRRRPQRLRGVERIDGILLIVVVAKQGLRRATFSTDRDAPGHVDAVLAFVCLRRRRHQR